MSGRFCQTKPIEESFKFEVSSVKLEKKMVGTSNSTLYTSHSPKAVRAKQSQFARSVQEWARASQRSIVRNKANFDTV